MNAEELILLQYELVKQRAIEKKKAIENYSKCLYRNDGNSTCLGALITETRNSDIFLDPDQFDNAIQIRCCKFCQTVWDSSKSVKVIKKRLAGLKQSMHALAKRLLKENNAAQQS